MVSGQSGPTASGWQGSGAQLAVALALVTAVVLVFGQTVGHEFLRWDDDGYIARNARVRQGLTWDNLVWAFTSLTMSNWHPLTWLSMMADVSLFGLWAGGHHLMSVAWHAANALLLYLALARMSGDVARSALVAALFALHPLHVESVAWIAERKDLLSGFFWILSIYLYVGYARAPTLRRYLAVAAAFAAALLSKPMAVTLPVILLLLDYWPLRRTRHTPLARLVAEKLPLAALSLASAALTLVAQAGGGSVRSLEQVGPADRAVNVLVGYATYLIKTLLPADLSFFYVYRPPSTTLIAASLVLLALLTGFALWRRVRLPFVAVGLAWFFVSLIPVIGIVRVGDQAWANRYSYLPLIGLFLALVWLLPVPRWPLRAGREQVIAAAWATVLVAIGAVAAAETAYWKSSETLFGRAIEVDPTNYVAYAQLAEHYAERRSPGEAEQAAQQAIRHAPARAAVAASAEVTLSRVYMETGRYAEAQQALDRAEAIHPELPVIPYNRGTLALLRQEPEQALTHLNRAVALKPDYSEAHNNRGAALARLGRLDEALAAHQAALQADPGNDDARYNLASTLERLGRGDEALREFESLAARAPRHLRARLRAARLADARGDAAAARQWAAQALALDPSNADARQLAGSAP